MNTAGGDQQQTGPKRDGIDLEFEDSIVTSSVIVAGVRDATATGSAPALHRLTTRGSTILDVDAIGIHTSYPEHGVYLYAASDDVIKTLNAKHSTLLLGPEHKSLQISGIASMQFGTLKLEGGSCTGTTFNLNSGTLKTEAGTNLVVERLNIPNATLTINGLVEVEYLNLRGAKQFSMGPQGSLIHQGKKLSEADINDLIGTGIRCRVEPYQTLGSNPTTGTDPTRRQAL